MNKSSLVAILTILMIAAPVVSAQDSLYARIDQLADQVDKNVIAWRHQIHQNSESPMREFGGPTGTRAAEGGKGQYANHSPYFYVNDEALKTGVRIYSNVVLDFLSGELLFDCMGQYGGIYSSMRLPKAPEDKWLESKSRQRVAALSLVLSFKVVSAYSVGAASMPFSPPP